MDEKRDLARPRFIQDVRVVCCLELIALKRLWTIIQYLYLIYGWLLLKLLLPLCIY